MGVVSAGTYRSEGVPTGGTASDAMDLRPGVGQIGSLLGSSPSPLSAAFDRGFRQLATESALPPCSVRDMTLNTPHDA
jgi:hypothetical protein